MDISDFQVDWMKNIFNLLTNSQINGTNTDDNEYFNDTIMETSTHKPAETVHDPWLNGFTMFVIYNVVRFVQVCTGLIGNFLTLIIIPRLERINNGHILIFNLCLSDLFVCLMWPLNLSVQLTHYKHFWAKLCIVKECMTTFGLTGSLLTYCAIAVDRFFLVFCPIKYKVYITRNKVLIAIAVVWVYNALLISGTTIFLGAPLEVLDKLQHCNLPNVITIKAYYYLVMPHMVFVALSMLICYVAVMIKLAIRDRGAIEMTAGGGNTNVNANQQNTLLAGKVTRSLVLVLGVFNILYFPIIIMHVVNAFVKTAVVNLIVDVFVLFFFLNNLLNPFIYYYKMTEFRSLYKSILRC